MATSWEENTERRLGIVEMKIDKLLDPESGIYPKIDVLSGRLRGWAIGILTALVLNLIGVIVSLLVMAQVAGG